MPYNMLWNIEIGQAIIINFKWAEIIKSRAMLGVILLDKFPTAIQCAKKAILRQFIKLSIRF